MSSVRLNGLAYKDIPYINNLPDGSTIVFKNTVGIDKEAIKNIKQSLVVRIIGGLDEVEKPKYNTQTYYDRTLYKPIEVYKIIEKMEAIESGMEPDWNDLDKAMYIYKQLCESINYDYVDVKINGRDYNRNLLGLLRGEAVCAGYSMIYKEMLERQGIRCIYQNKQHGHAWNLVEINGKLVPVDLTFDVGYRSKEGKCKFCFFGSSEEFFEDPNHIATGEDRPFTSSITDEEFSSAYHKVVDRRKLNATTQYYVNSRVEKVSYYIIPEENFKRIILYCNGVIKTVVYDDSVDENEAIHFDYFAYKEDRFVYTLNRNNKIAMDALNGNCRIFNRDDKSTFMLRASSMRERNVISHDYISFDEQSNIKIDKLYSEDNLAKAPETLKPGIANILLSSRRVKEKINRFKGYVGYLEIEKGRYQKYYNARNEQMIAGFAR